LISAIGAIGHDCDPEYLRIIRELQRYGLTPSGNKNIDKSRLEQAKEKEKQAEAFLLQEIKKPEDNQDEARAQLEELRTGATTLAQINRILLGI